MPYKKADLAEFVARLSESYSDDEITKAFAAHWDSLAMQATTAKNAASNAADAQAWHEAYLRWNKRALFWWQSNTMSKPNKRGTHG